jgi:hypothetical protein
MPPAGGTDAEFTRRNTVRNLSARLHYPGVDAGLLFTGTRPVGEDNRMASRSANRRAGFCGFLRIAPDTLARLDVAIETAMVGAKRLKPQPGLPTVCI